MRQVRCSARSSGTETEHEFKLEYSGNNGFMTAVLKQATLPWADQEPQPLQDNWQTGDIVRALVLGTDPCIYLQAPPTQPIGKTKFMFLLLDFIITWTSIQVRSLDDIFESSFFLSFLSHSSLH